MKAGREILPHIPIAAVLVDSPSERRSLLGGVSLFSNRGTKPCLAATPSPIKSLLKSVQRRLERTGSRNRLNATIRQGTVTLTGQLQYEKQRLQIMNAIKGVSGVRQVLDQLVSPPKVKPQAAYNAGAVAAVRSQPKSAKPTAKESAAGDQEETVGADTGDGVTDTELDETN